MTSSSTALLNRLLAGGKFRHLQVLLRLAELGSVQRTADAIGLTQSSVTQSLAYLEGLMETRLFDRHARGVRPTAACNDLLPVVRTLMRGIAEGAEAITARLHRGEGQVRLAASAAATNGLLDQVLPAFNDRCPEIQVLHREAEGDDQLLAIARGEVDLVACREPPVVPDGWVFTPLLEDRIVVVCNTSHRLARARRVRWTALADETWLLVPAGTAVRRRFDELAARFGAAVRAYPLITQSVTANWALLQQRPVLGFLPFSFVRRLVETGALAEVPVDEALPLRPLGLLRPADGGGAAAARLATHLIDAYPAVLPPGRRAPAVRAAAGLSPAARPTSGPPQPTARARPGTSGSRRRPTSY